MDKIFVSDFLKEVEIGAFQSERGCTQRVRFNVSLDLKPFNIEIDDNVDNVLSYEIITDAINFELSSRRFNLLETLAEKVAQRCLLESRVIRAEVQIEKLDRIPGSLGVFISRVKEHNKRRNIEVSEEIDPSEINLVSFSGIMMNTPEMKSWLSSLLGSKKKITVLVDCSAQSIETLGNNTAMLQVALFGMDQNAWRLSCLDERLSVVSSKSELYWMLNRSQITFFCLSHFTKNLISSIPDLLKNYDEFLVWFAKELGLENLCIVGRDINRLKANSGKLNIKYFNRHDWTLFNET